MASDKSAVYVQSVSLEPEGEGMGRSARDNSSGNAEAHKVTDAVNTIIHDVEDETMRYVEESIHFIQDEAREMADAVNQVISDVEEEAKHFVESSSHIVHDIQDGVNDAIARGMTRSELLPQHSSSLDAITQIQEVCVVDVDVDAPNERERSVRAAPQYVHY